MKSVRAMQSICDDPIGAEEEIMSAFMQSLEEAGGMSIYREPKLVSHRDLDFSSIAEPEADDQNPNSYLTER